MHRDGIIFLVYNYVRVLGILGYKGLKKHLEGCFLSFSDIRRAIERITTLEIFSSYKPV